MQEYNTEPGNRPPNHLSAQNRTSSSAAKSLWPPPSVEASCSQQQVCAAYGDGPGQAIDCMQCQCRGAGRGAGRQSSGRGTARVQNLMWSHARTQRTHTHEGAKTSLASPACCCKAAGAGVIGTRAYRRRPAARRRRRRPRQARSRGLGVPGPWTRDPPTRTRRADGRRAGPPACPPAPHGQRPTVTVAESSSCQWAASMLGSVPPPFTRNQPGRDSEAASSPACGRADEPAGRRQIRELVSESRHPA